jgi:hypothetical protein
MRHELLKKLSHDEVQPLPKSALPASPHALVDQPLAAKESMVSTTTAFASCTSDAQVNSKIIADVNQTTDSCSGNIVLQNINGAVPTPTMVQDPRKHSTSVTAAGESN